MSLDDFRQDTRKWLAAHCPESMRTAIPEGELVWGASHVEFVNDDQKVWFNAMRDKGWFCPDWPTEYGGGGLDATHQKVLEQELKAINARPPQINLGIWMLGPVLLEYGTEAQNSVFYQLWPVVKCAGVKVLASPMQVQIWLVFERLPKIKVITTKSTALRFGPHMVTNPI